MAKRVYGCPHRKVNNNEVLSEEEADGTTTEQSNVDLAEEVTQTIVAQRGYEANLKALKAQNDALGSVLNILV